MNSVKRTDRFSPPVVGGSSLLVIFAVLCLVTFAVLSLSSTQANIRLAEASRAAVEDYYAADLKAEEILAEIRNGNIPEGVSVEGDWYRYTCAISETQELQVEVRCSGTDWEILRWQAVSVMEWNSDERIEVWDGTIPDPQ
ncbi:MAG: hypothetical protein IJ486_06125 [Firmicutes bacterium]|nr:hypothetical protein [Bacillota bacterium]